MGSYFQELISDEAERRCAVSGPLSSFKCQLSSFILEEVLHPVALVLLRCSL